MYAGRLDGAFILGRSIYARWRHHMRSSQQPPTSADALWFHQAATRLAEIT